MKLLLTSLSFVLLLGYTFPLPALATDVTIMSITLGRSLKDANIPPCNFRQEQSICWNKKPGSYYGRVGLMTAKYLSVWTKTDVTIKNNDDNPDEENIKKIRIEFRPSSGEYMFDLLRDKFGKPNSYKETTLKNAMGATFNSFSADWMIDGQFIAIEGMMSVDKGVILLLDREETGKWMKKIIGGKDRDKEKF